MSEPPGCLELRPPGRLEPVGSIRIGARYHPASSPVKARRPHGQRAVRNPVSGVNRLSLVNAVALFGQWLRGDIHRGPARGFQRPPVSAARARSVTRPHHRLDCGISSNKCPTVEQNLTARSANSKLQVSRPVLFNPNRDLAAFWPGTTCGYPDAGSGMMYAAVRLVDRRSDYG